MFFFIYETRLWIGIWSGIMLFLLVAIDASAFVCYITRFTEELFASLVAFIFIMSAFKSTFHIREEVAHLPCLCYPPGTNHTNMAYWSEETNATVEMGGYSFVLFYEIFRMWNNGI